ncbi:MAG: phosphoribosylglycinamide formyltransferase [Bacteroidales bacterium]|nr:MAG: phosphoribosylglycinamide formyltransferase [Bacteroidales bacterium]
MKRIAIFASGSGTNAQNIIEYFQNHHEIDVTLVLSNKKDAYVLERASRFNVPTRTFTREEFYQSESVLETLRQHKIDFIVLAGFLWLIPTYLLQVYTGRMINIHPALLPKYGGKGMYGKYVHEAVLANGEKESGISIHFVNEEYDKGDIIFQARCPVENEDTPESLARRIHKLEYEHFPKVIEQVISGIG